MILKLQTTGVLILAAASAAFAAAPDISVEETIVDLGRVAQGEISEVEFSVENRGDEPLELVVRPTCGCTVADFDKLIPAHSRGTVNARVDTSSFSGPISKSVLVLSNDPDEPSLNLVIRADVRPVLAILPRPLVRMETDLGRPVSERVIIAAADETTGDFRITKVSSDAGYLFADVHRLEGDDLVPDAGEYQYELKIHLTEDAPAGFVNTPLTIETDHPDAERLELRVVATVRS